MFLSTVLLPVIFFIYKRRKGKIINRDAVIKEERTDVYRFGIILFVISYILVVLFRSHIFIQIYFLNYSLSTFGVLMINKKFKISIHSMTPAGMSALLLFIDPLLATFVLLIMIVVMWSRLELKVHTLKEVIAGMIYGFCLTLIITILVLSYAT
jgi:membrane-associated phospholipid phosphatase